MSGSTALPHRSHNELDEAIGAGYRTLLAVTAALGTVLSMAALAAAPAIGTIALGLTLFVALGALSVGRSARLSARIAIASGYAAMVLWFAALLQFHEEAILVPAGMAALCAAAASHFWADAEDAARAGAGTPAPSTPDGAEAWIEEDGRRIPD